MLGEMLWIVIIENEFQTLNMSTVLPATILEYSMTHSVSSLSVSDSGFWRQIC